MDWLKEQGTPLINPLIYSASFFSLPLASNLYIEQVTVEFSLLPVSVSFLIPRNEKNSNRGRFSPLLRNPSVKPFFPRKLLNPSCQPGQGKIRKTLATTPIIDALRHVRYAQETFIPEEVQLNSRVLCKRNDSQDGVVRWEEFWRSKVDGIDVTRLYMKESSDSYESVYLFSTCKWTERAT